MHDWEMIHETFLVQQKLSNQFTFDRKKKKKEVALDRASVENISELNMVNAKYKFIFSLTVIWMGN